MADGLFDSSALYQLLVERGVLPRLVNADPYGQSGAGLFDPSTNVVVAKDPSRAQTTAIQNERRDTLTHELTHAAQLNLFEPMWRKIRSKVKAEEKLTTDEQRFYSAFDKLMSHNDSLNNMLTSLYTPTNDPRKDQYRTTPVELQAWGTGYMSKPYNVYSKEKSNINPHLNPTMATEFSILSELYNKLPKSLKDDIISNVNKDIKANRKKDPNDFYKESVDLFSDPFAPTIK